MQTQQQKGFEWHCEPANHLITIRIWGLWDKKYAEYYRTRVKSQMNTIKLDGEEWYLLVDVRKFSPHPTEIQGILSQEVLFANEATIRKRAVLVADTLPHFTVSGTSSPIKLPTYSYFQSEESALQWLLGSTDSERRKHVPHSSALTNTGEPVLNSSASARAHFVEGDEPHTGRFHDNSSSGGA